MSGTDVKRGPMVRAKQDQPVSFVLTQHKCFHHGTLEAAEIERDYLQHPTGEDFYLIKVLNVKKSDVGTAHQIAAASEMHEALKCMISYLQSAVETGHTIPAHAWGKIHAAVSKAEGL